MIFKNGTYDKLKWFCLVAFPAIITFFGVLGDTLNWSFTQPTITIAVAFNAMLGTMLGISNIKYKSIQEFEDAGDEEELEENVEPESEVVEEPVEENVEEQANEQE